MRMRRARSGDLPVVLEILDEASEWLHRRGIRQWPKPWPAEYVRPAVEAGETWLADVDGHPHPVGTVTLQWADPIWSDVDTTGAEAGYVHRLAVRRDAAGVGRSLLDWAGATTRDHGRSLLRLDTLASNTRLCAYYLDLGFRPRGEVDVTGPPGPRREEGEPVRLARFELRLVPAGGA